MSFTRLPFVAGVTAVVVTACGSPTVATAVLTPAQARAAAQNYDLVDSQASAQCNATLNNTVEAGDLAAIDNADAFNPAVCAVRGTPPPPPASPRPIPDNLLVVPRATSYPAFFLYYAETDLGRGAGPQPVIWVIASDKSGAPWKAEYQVILTAGPLLTFSRDAHGYAPAPLAPSASGYRLTPAATCDTAARYFTAVYGGASTRAGLTDPPRITNIVASYRTEDAQLREQKAVVTDRTWTCARSAVAEATKSGDALVVFTVRGAYDFTPPPNEQFYINTRYAGGQTVQLVPPGLYKHATATELTILAAVVPASRSNATPQLIGGYSGIVNTTDTPA